MKISSNHKPRQLIDGSELTEKERKEFDYLKWEGEEANGPVMYFFRYKGQVYHLAESTFYPHVFWHGAYMHTAFSGVLVHLCENEDYVIIGSYTE